MAIRGSKAKLTYWSCLRTRFREEARAAHYVENLSFEHYLPRVAVLLRPGVERREPLFPGFLFVRVDLRRRWQALHYARGVSSLFMCGDYPTRVPDAEVAAVRGREDARGLIILQPEFSRGQRVRVRDEQGSLAGLVGEVEFHASAAQRCAVLVEVLGRAVRFEFDARQLEAA